MGITISGENNNDRILASDGVIDQLSGFNVVGVMTATSFTGDLTGDVTGNLTGNVTGNINNSTLLLQTGGSERIRITGNNEIGIAGANYGTSGQVLTSGGSGSAVSWTTISGTTINNNANNRIITGSGTANTLEAETSLEWNGADTLTVVHPSSYQDFIVRTSAGGGSFELFRTGNGPFRIRSASTSPSSEADELVVGATNSTRGLTIFGDTNNIYFGDAGDNDIGKIQYVHSDNSMRFTTNTSERLRITSTGRVGINESTVDTQLHVSGSANAQTTAGAGTNTAIRITDTDTSAQSGQVYGEIQFETRDASSAGVAAYLTAQGNSSGQASMMFGTGSGGSASTKMVLHHSGNASLGTEVPNEYSNQTTFTINGTNNGRLDLEVGGTLRGSVWADSGGLGLDAGGNEIEFYAGSAERLRITSGGQVRIGNANNLALWGQNQRLQVAGSGSWSDSGITIACMSTTGQTPNLIFGASRGATPGTALNNGDRLGYISFVGDDGTDMHTVGAAIISGTDAAASSNSISGTLQFYTGSNASGNERLRIDSNGRFCFGTYTNGYQNNDSVANFVNAASSGTENPLITLWNPTTVADSRADIDFLTNAQSGTGRDGAFISARNDGVTAKAHLIFGTIKDETYTKTVKFDTNGDVEIEDGNLVIKTSGHGIDFSATANSSGSVDAELLDDYEEGSFTASYSVASGSITNFSSRGEYVKIGRVVHFMFSCSANGSNNPSGQVTITGLPFTAEIPNASGPRGGGGVVFAGYHAPPELSTCQVTGTTINLRLNNNTYLQANTSGTGFGYNAYQISGFGSYMTTA